MARAALTLSPRQRVERALALALAALPPKLQVRLSRKAPVEVEGEVLAPDVQLMLSLLERRGGTPLETLTPAQTRATRRQLAALYDVRGVDVGAVEDLQIDATGGAALRARHYAPSEAGGPHPLLVFFHGGGFTFGDLDTHDGICRMLCRHGGTHVLAVDYRLAPEHPFPAAVEDAFTAVRFAVHNAERLGADSRRVGVAGDSAGGNLAAVVAQRARDEGLALALQLLMYPATDSTGRRRSRELFGAGFVLTDAELDWFEANYVGAGGGNARDPRISPLLAEDLSGLAPALVITAAFDPLRDEAEDYARALQRAGTPAVLRRFPGVTHSFLAAAGISRRSRDALAEIAGATRAMFAGAPVHAPEHQREAIA